MVSGPEFEGTCGRQSKEMYSLSFQTELRLHPPWKRNLLV